MRTLFLASLLVLSTAACAAPSAKPQAPKNAPHSDAHEESHEHATKPYDPNESNSDYLWRKSDEAFHAGDFERAIGLHKAIVALDPADTESFGVAAWLMWSLGKGDDAIAHIQRGLKSNPTNWEMWNEAGQQFDLQKKLPEAKDAYANAVKFIPASEDSQMLRRRLAHAAEKAGDNTLALETWRALVKDFPSEAVNKNNLARVEKLPLQQTTMRDSGVKPGLDLEVHISQYNPLGAPVIKYNRVGANVGF